MRSEILKKVVVKSLNYVFNSKRLKLYIYHIIYLLFSFLPQKEKQKSSPLRINTLKL